MLVIKLGALGDFIHAMHAFAAIRDHHPKARITLLTTAPFLDLARASPWFDAVQADTRPPWWDLMGRRRTKRLVQGFDLVYDMQTSSRSGRYFIMAGRPHWSGIAPGCSYPHTNPGRNAMHTLERQREQLQSAGIVRFPRPERDWLVARGATSQVRPPFALLVPGSSKGAHCPKRWPADRYGQLARNLHARGIIPVVVGMRNERAIAARITGICRGAVDLTGRTTLFDLAALSANATVVLGNDTGPVHLAAFMGAPTVALFSATSSIAQAAPRGPAQEWVTTLQRPILADLPEDEVAAAVNATAAASCPGRPGSVGRRQAEPQQQEEPAADR